MPSDELKKTILGRQAKLKSEKERFKTWFQDVADYVAPHLEDMDGTALTGEQKGKKIFDGTAQSAAVLATDGIHGYHVSPAFPWFRYAMNVDFANKSPEVRKWLQDTESAMYRALNRSNFYGEMWPLIYSGLTMGTGVFYPREDVVSGRIIFESIHIGEAYIAENSFGEVDIMHRRRKMTARKMMQQFGEEVPQEVKDIAREHPFQEFWVLHAVFPREEFDDSQLGGKNKRFASVWIFEAQGKVAQEKIMRESGFDSFRYRTWRYMRTGKEPYGISPAMLAIADIRGLNLMSKTILNAAQLAIDPAITAPAYLKGELKLKPRGLNYTKDPNDKILPINQAVGYPIGIDREQAKQRAIKERFHVDTFLLLNQIAGEGGQRTAYEVSQLMAEKAAVLGAELGPLNTFLDGVLDDVYEIESESGRMPEVPDVLFELAEQDPDLKFEPEYQGPLAQAQRQTFGKENIRKFFLDISPLIEISPDVLDNYDLDAAANELADLNSLPEAIRLPKEVVAAKRKGREEAMAMQNQQEQAMAMMDGLKTASEADKNLGGQLSAAVSGALP